MYDLNQFFAHRSLPFVKNVAAYVEARAEQLIVAGYDARESYQIAISEALAETQTLSDQYVAATAIQYPPGKAKDGKLTLSLGEILDTRQSYPAKIKRRRMFEGVDSNVVYVVRDGETALYVGCTGRSAEYRLRGHISGKSDLGKAIASDPRSNEWQVEMISHPDKKSALAKERELQAELRPKFCNDRFIHKENTQCQQS